MTLALALALALALPSAGAQQTPPELPVYDGEEVRVIAERLKSLEVNIARDRHGRYSCGLSGTTGVPQLDERLCRAATDCTRRYIRRPAKLKSCIIDRKPGLIADLRRQLGGGA